MQLDMFESEGETLARELALIKEQVGSVRRGLFARHGELVKLMEQLESRLEKIEKKEGTK